MRSWQLDGASRFILMEKTLKPVFKQTQEWMQMRGRTSRLMGVGLLLCASLVGGCTQQGTPRPGIKSEERAQMTADSLYMARVHAQWSHGRSQSQMPMDLADETQYRFLMNRVKAAGHTAQSSPQLFKRLDQQRTLALARHGQKISAMQEESQTPWCSQLLPLQDISDDAGGHFTASGYVTCFGGADYSYVDVDAYSTTPEHGQFILLNSTSSDGYSEKTLETESLDLHLDPGPDRVLYVDSVAMGYNEETGNSETLYNAVEVTALTVAGTTTNLTFDHPKNLIDHTDPYTGLYEVGVTRTCLLRGGVEGGFLDCDYGGVERDVTKGTITPFPGPNYNAIAAIDPTASSAQNKWIPSSSDIWMTPHRGPGWFLPARGLFTTGLPNDCYDLDVRLTVNLILLEAGGSCAATVGSTVATTGPLFFTNVISPSEATFNGVLDFGTDCTVYQKDVKFFATATATATCPSATGKTIQMSRIKPVNLSPLDFKNSCLAAGTQVQLANGTSVAVERVKVGDQVVSNGQGRALTVNTLTRGVEPTPMVQLKDGQGHELLVTRTHPMVTRGQGVVAAEKLTVGDVLLTRKGEVKLTSVNRLPYTGMVYNLTLGTPQELKTVGALEHTFYANGFLVGDNKMQTDLERQPPPPSDVLARLNPAWHNDYLHAQARRAVHR